MTVLAHSLNGLLRIRQLSKTKAVVELRGHLFPGSWHWCVYRNMTLDKAWDLFTNQCQYHLDPTVYFKPIVQPGV